MSKNLVLGLFTLVVMVILTVVYWETPAAFWLCWAVLLQMVSLFAFYMARRSGEI